MPRRKRASQRQGMVTVGQAGLADVRHEVGGVAAANRDLDKRLRQALVDQKPLQRLWAAVAGRRHPGPNVPSAQALTAPRQSAGRVG